MDTARWAQVFVAIAGLGVAMIGIANWPDATGVVFIAVGVLGALTALLAAWRLRPSARVNLFSSLSPEFQLRVENSGRRPGRFTATREIVQLHFQKMVSPDNPLEIPPAKPTWVEEGDATTAEIIPGDSKTLRVATLTDWRDGEGRLIGQVLKLWRYDPGEKDWCDKIRWKFEADPPKLAIRLTITSDPAMRRTYDRHFGIMVEGGFLSITPVNPRALVRADS